MDSHPPRLRTFYDIHYEGPSGGEDGNDDGVTEGRRPDDHTGNETAQIAVDDSTPTEVSDRMNDSYWKSLLRISSKLQVGAVRLLKEAVPSPIFVMGSCGFGVEILVGDARDPSCFLGHSHSITGCFHVFDLFDEFYEQIHGPCPPSLGDDGRQGSVVRRRTLYRRQTPAGRRTSGRHRKWGRRCAASRHERIILRKRRAVKKNYSPLEALYRMLYLNVSRPSPNKHLTVDQGVKEPVPILLPANDDGSPDRGFNSSIGRIIPEKNSLKAQPAEREYFVIVFCRTRSTECCIIIDDASGTDCGYGGQSVTSLLGSIEEIPHERDEGNDTSQSRPLYNLPSEIGHPVIEQYDIEQSDIEQLYIEGVSHSDLRETFDGTATPPNQCDVSREKVNEPDGKKTTTDALSESEQRRRDENEPPAPISCSEDSAETFPKNPDPMKQSELSDETETSHEDGDVPSRVYEHSTIEYLNEVEAWKDRACPLELGATFTEDPLKGNSAPRPMMAASASARAGPSHEPSSTLSLGCHTPMRKGLLSEPDYCRERDRLASFSQAPSKAKFDAIICAKYGLWYTGWKDCAACFYCPFRHWDWRPDQDPRKLHIENSPNCPVAQGDWPADERFEPQMTSLSDAGKAKVGDRLRSLLPRQMALEETTTDAKRRYEEEKKLFDRYKLEDSVAVHHRLSEAPLGEPKFGKPTSDEAATSLPEHVPGGATKIIYYALEHTRDGRQPRCVPHIVDPKATVAQKSGVPDELRSERKRIDSYKKWLNPPFNVYDYARNGFFFTENNRDIKCAFCGGVLAVPNVLRRFSITAKHKRAFPTCPLVLKLEVGNVPLPVDETLNLPKSNTESPAIPVADPIGLEPIVTIKFPQFSDRQSRILSFMSWLTEYHQKSDALVESGFFCLGDGDAVRCFHCGGGLRNWEPTDEPWREHARWFPRCGYLQQKKGIDFVKRVQAESDVSNWIPSVAGGSGAGAGAMSFNPMSSNAILSNEETSLSFLGRPRKLNLTRSGIPSPAPTTPRFLNGPYWMMMMIH